MKVEVIFEINVPDEPDSSYLCENTPESLKLEVGDKFETVIKRWICQEIVPDEFHDKVEVRYKR